ncbi:agnoprotein [Rhinolophus hipposideros polyomavirus 1]|nr:agnoprotein [Rhinolophus hipposideros polyomavirus 1]
MGQTKLLWQSLKCLLTIYNVQQGSKYSHLEEILQLLQDLFEFIKEDPPTDSILQNSIFWELCTFKQKICDLIKSTYEKIKFANIFKECKVRITPFSKRSTPPTTSHTHSSCLADFLAESPDVADCPDAVAPFPPGASNQTLDLEQPDPPVTQQERGCPCDSCAFLRNQLVLAQRLHEVVSELQDVLL